MHKKNEVPRAQKCPGAATFIEASSGAYENNTIRVFNSQQIPGDFPTDISAIAQVLSADRFNTYEQTCNGDQARALRLYSWNIAVAAAFWGGFNVLEVTFRNSIHRRLTNFVEREDWWNGPIPLHKFEKYRLTEAQNRATKLHGPRVQPGHVIAELSYGFWTALLANRYHQRLWTSTLDSAFPNYAGARKDLHRQHESLRKLRNRIAHHEPIFTRNLADDHKTLLVVISAISNEAALWVQSNSRVPQLLEDKDHMLDERITMAF